MDRDYRSLVPSVSGMDFQGQDIRDLYNTYLGDEDKSRDEPLVRDGELFFFDQYDEYRTSHGGDDHGRRDIKHVGLKQIPSQSHSGPVYQDYQQQQQHQQGKVHHSNFDTKRDSYGFPMSNVVNFGQTQYTSQYDNTRVDSYCPSYQEHQQQQQPSSPHYVHGKIPGIQQPRQESDGKSEMVLSSRGPTSVTYDPHSYQQETLGCRWHPFAQGPSSETGQCTCGANTNQAEYFSSGPEQRGAHWEHEPYMQSYSCSHDYKRGPSAGIEGQGGGIGTNTQADWITQKFHESTNLLPDDTFPLQTSIESSGLLVLPTPVRAGDSLRYTSPSRSPYALRRVKRRGAAGSDADQHTPKATRKQVTIEACDLQQAGNREHQRQYKKISDARDDSELSEEDYEEEDKKEDTDTEIKLQDSNILEKIPSKNRRRVRGPKSWEFLVRLLADPRTNPSLVRWEDESDYTFKLSNPSMVAQLWSSRSGLANSMTYNNFARGLRYHYSTGALEPVSEKQLVYRCGTPAIQYLKELKGKSTVADL